MKKYTLKEKIVIEFKNDYVQFDSSLKWNWFCFNVVQIVSLFQNQILDLET